MQTEQPWYIGLRSEALAIVSLTRRDDLLVSQQQKDKDTGLDLLVKITKDGNYTGRIFGVQVKATVSSSELIQDDDIFKLKNQEYNNLKVFRDLPFPVCLLFITHLELLYLATRLAKSFKSIGLEIYSLTPAAKQLSRSPFIAIAV